MKIFVLGWSELTGFKFCNLVRKHYLDGISTSLDDGVNTVTGEGLDEAFEDAEAVVDLTNSPSFEDTEALEFFETSGRNIIAAELKAGVEQHIALSVVGADRLQES